MADNARRIAHIACAQPLPSDISRVASSNSFEDLLILPILLYIIPSGGSEYSDQEPKHRRVICLALSLNTSFIPGDRGTQCVGIKHQPNVKKKRAYYYPVIHPAERSRQFLSAPLAAGRKNKNRQNLGLDLVEYTQKRDPLYPTPMRAPTTLWVAVMVWKLVSILHAEVFY